MAGITNRDPNLEDKNQRVVEENKREIDHGNAKPGIQRGSSPREKFARDESGRPAVGGDRDGTRRPGENMEES